MLAVSLLVLSILCLAPIAHADNPSTDIQRELRIERTLACPQCTDLPLDICEQDICNDMRAIIHEKVATGESDRDIQQYFVGRYGARVLLAPPKDSRNFIFWALPFAVLALGTGLAILFLRSSMRRRQAFDPALSQGRGQSGADRFMPSYAQRDRWGSQVEHDVEELE